MRSPLNSFLLAGIFFFFAPSWAKDTLSVELEKFRVDSLVFEIGDAFDDSKAYTALDSGIYRLLNFIHLETRPSVIKKLILPKEGDLTDEYELIESERLLREQRYISDASIKRETVGDKNLLRIQTSDNWTLSIPLSLEHPGDEWYYGIGIQENNFLGFGQTLGFYYSHDEFRDMYSALYENTHFLFRYNHLKASYSHNSDGYTAFAQMNIPFLSRTKNEWAYTLEAFSTEGDNSVYWSGILPPRARAAKDFLMSDSSLKKLPKLNGEKPLEVLKFERLQEDSLSFRFARSLGSQERKFYLLASYDYHDFGTYSEVKRNVFKKKGAPFVLPEEALSDWLFEKRDSRFGLSVEYSKIRYERFRNFHNVKWVEDLDRGYALKVKLSKNFEELGASDDDWRIDYRLSLSLGNEAHNLSLLTRSFFYFNEESRQNIYELLSAEYIWKPTPKTASALLGQMDAFKRSPYMRQLTLGGIEGMNGLPSALFAGQARFFGKAEQRFFPDIEIGTIVPVFVVFGAVGETASTIEKFEPRDLQYLAGVGVRIAMTKSIMRSVSHIDLAWPIHGPEKKSYIPKISIIGRYSL